MTNGVTNVIRDNKDLVLTMGGMAAGFLLFRKLMSKLSGNPDCPLRTEWYGGLPEVGGYGSSTEYEIGAQRITEAAHCILGSLGKLLCDYRPTESHPSWQHGLRYESGHIAEEMEIINKSAKEYSRPLYNDRLLPSHIESWVGGHPDQLASRLAYARKSVDSIRKASPKLVEIAERNLTALARESMPEPIWRVADNTYRMVISLAQEMEQSVRRYPDRVDNAFRSSDFNYRRVLLSASVDKLLAAKSKEGNR